MKAIAKDWSGLAFNQVPNSSNKIHSDELAQAFGFKGGLVPGVTLSAYLAHSAIQAWGLDWLQNGFAHIKVESPVYDGKSFSVEVEGDEGGYSADLMSEGKRCAMAHIQRSANTDFQNSIPEYQSLEILNKNYQAPLATPENMQKLKQQGCHAVEFLWSADHEMSSYLSDRSSMPLLLSVDARKEASGLANLSFLLGCANRHFAAVASMSPWVHVESKSQNYLAVTLGTTLISEMVIVDLFNKKGHEFADCVFNLFDKKTKSCVCSIWQRAIYKMRDF